MFAVSTFMNLNWRQCSDKHSRRTEFRHYLLHSYISSKNHTFWGYTLRTAFPFPDDTSLPTGTFNIEFISRTSRLLAYDFTGIANTLLTWIQCELLSRFVLDTLVNSWVHVSIYLISTWITENYLLRGWYVKSIKTLTCLGNLENWHI